MENDILSTLDLGGLARHLTDQLRRLARPDAGAPEGPAEGARPGVLGEVLEQLRGAHARGQDTLQADYRARTDAMHAVVRQRRQRLEAYAVRRRQAVPAVADAFVVAGRVTDRQTGDALPYVRVRITGAAGGAPAETRTDALGYYRFTLPGETTQPEQRVEVLDEQGGVLEQVPHAIRPAAGQSVFAAAAVDGARLPTSRDLGAQLSLGVARRQEELARRSRTLQGAPTAATSLREADTPAVAPLAPTSPGLATLVRGAAAAAQGGGRAPDAPKTPVLTDVEGIGPAFGRRLEKAGIVDPGALAAEKPEKVASVLKVSERRAGDLIAAARNVTRKR